MSETSETHSDPSDSEQSVPSSDDKIGSPFGQSPSRMAIRWAAGYAGGLSGLALLGEVLQGTVRIFDVVIGVPANFVFWFVVWFVILWLAVTVYRRASLPARHEWAAMVAPVVLLCVLGVVFIIIITIAGEELAQFFYGVADGIEASQ